MIWQRRAGAALLFVLVALALIGPVLGGDPLAQGDPVNGAFLFPSATHWLGTDQLARDVFSRLAHGARVSLVIAAIAVAVAAALGSVIGLIAGATDGIAGRAAQRLIDLGLALPRIIVLLVVLASVGRIPPVVLGVALGLTGWPGVARLVRGETLRLAHAPYVLAAHALGAPRLRVVVREIYPGTVPALLVASTLGVADVILLEAGLSFIGVGIRAPEPSWGGMILEARDHLANAPWLMLAPCVALVVATTAATLLGEALRRSLQPETR